MRSPLCVVIALLFAAGCSKSDSADKGKADKPGKAGSTLAWKPDGMDKLTPACLKSLACCEAVVAVNKPSATADDYNLECSGVVAGGWSDADCAKDATSRAADLGDKKPDVCK